MAGSKRSLDENPALWTRVTMKGWPEEEMMITPLFYRLLADRFGDRFSVRFDKYSTGFFSSVKLPTIFFDDFEDGKKYDSEVAPLLAAATKRESQRVADFYNLHRVPLYSPYRDFAFNQPAFVVDHHTGRPMAPNVVIPDEVSLFLRENATGKFFIHQPDFTDRTTALLGFEKEEDMEKFLDWRDVSKGGDFSYRIRHKMKQASLQTR